MLAGCARLSLFRSWFRPLVAGLLACILLRGQPAGAADEVKFGRDVLPILSAHCFACHGPDEQARKGDLRLDLSEAAFAARDGAPAVKPGSLDESEVWQRVISTDESLVMPPPSAKKPLSDVQKATLKKWIEQGARYERHWAFVPTARPEPPVVDDAAWKQNPVDRFLLSRLKKEGMSPRPEASRATLIRRVAFALTGLPPTPKEVEQYEQDSSSQAYENMVDRYLASTRYGEEMARHWLDVARYADTHGLHLDNAREMWAYRDWVISAFNRNLPFDRFTIEQLAGDQLPSPTRDQLIATGFNRCNVTTSEGGAIDSEFLFRYAVDRTSTMIQAWMGLTGGCAVCHDHKYDPLTMKEFYSLYSFFYSAADPAMDRNINTTDPFLRLPNAEQEQDLAALRQAEQQAKLALEEFTAKLDLVDPAEASAPPEKQAVHDVWFDDLFPAGARVTSSSRNAPVWSLAPQSPVVSGIRALRQASAAMYTDKAENFGVSLVVPEKAVFQIYVRLDPFEPPQSLLLELQTSKGARRALWGDAEKLGSGQIGTPERLRVGDLPAAGQWVMLQVTGEQWQLAGGETVRGFSLGQFGGIADWDRLSVQGELAPAVDPRASFKAWWKDRTGIDTPGVPGEIQAALKDGPEKEVTPEIKLKLKAFYLNSSARPQSLAWLQARNRFELAQAQRLALEESLPGTFIFKDLEKPRDAFVMLRGQYDKPGDKVEPGVPSVFPPLKVANSSARPNRLDLANWLVSPEHPLTARVAVNRLWQQFFGTGLVKTSYDFGAQGEPPSHPELLDWLANSYRDSGWDTKAFVRLLVTSAAFRQDARVLPDVLARDPENRLYARGPRIRLDAEQIRDNSLFVSGLMSLKMGGPGAFPYQPPNIWEPVGYADSNTRFYLQDHGEPLYRRSVYCFLKRTAPPPFMSNFDGPNREQFCTKRERTNTPLQALQLLNDTQQFEAARALAERVLLEGGQQTEERLGFAYRVVLARAPAAEELAIVKDVLAEFLARYGADPGAAESVVKVGESSRKAKTNATELAAWTLVANLILNLDETVTRN